jgi:conjugal transfer pilus assembly protein TraD
MLVLTAFIASVVGTELSAPAILSAGLLSAGFYNLVKALPRVRKQLSMFVNKLMFMDIAELRKLNRSKFNADPRYFKNLDSREIYLADGFEWGPQQAQRAYQLMDMSTDLSEMALPFVTKPYVRKYRKKTKSLGGLPWIYSVGDNPEKQMLPEEAFFGHSFISGQVGMGKTSLLKILGIGFMHLGHSLIVIDPKDDPSLKKGLRNEAKALGIEDKFYEFCPARPTESCAIDILHNFSTNAEIPTRVAGLLKTGNGGSDSFIDFGWQCISQIVDGMIYCGENPRLTEIYRYMRTGKNELLDKVLNKFYTKRFGKNWQVEHLEKMEAFGDTTLSQMAGYYNAIPSSDKVHEVDDVMQYVTHNQEHAQKMLASVFPLFKVLCSKPLDVLLSPKRGETTQTIIDIKRVIMDGGIIYCSLNSMSDPKTAGYLARLLLADVAACLGDRYNYGDGEDRRLSVLVDEVHAAIEGNDSLINNLAQGRAARAQFVLSTQTIPDLIDKTSDSTAERFLGLCNNFFSMKVTDPRTQEYVAKQFNKTSIRDTTVQYSISSDTKSSMVDFSGGYRETMTKSREDMFPESLIGDLPKLQFVARLATGQKLCCKLPIIKDEKAA